MKNILAVLLIIMSGVASATDLGLGHFYVEGQIGGVAKPICRVKDVPNTYFLGVVPIGFAASTRVGYDFSVGNFLSLGVEAGYLYLGSSEKSYTTAANQNGFDLLAVSGLHLNESWTLVGKVGAAYVSQKTTSYDLNVKGPVTATVSGWLPKVEVGINYNLNKNATITLSANHIFGSTLGLNELNLAEKRSKKPLNSYSVNLGFRYNFV